MILSLSENQACHITTCGYQPQYNLLLSLIVLLIDWVSIPGIHSSYFIMDAVKGQKSNQSRCSFDRQQFILRETAACQRCSTKDPINGLVIDESS